MGDSEGAANSPLYDRASRVALLRCRLSRARQYPHSIPDAVADSGLGPNIPGQTLLEQPDLLERTFLAVFQVWSALQESGSVPRKPVSDLSGVARPPPPRFLLGQLQSKA